MDAFVNSQNGVAPPFPRFLREGGPSARTKICINARQGTLDAFGIRWKIAKALIGEWVQLERVGERVLVYYCRTLIRELNLQSQSSVAVQRWRPWSQSDTDAAS